MFTVCSVRIFYKHKSHVEEQTLAVLKSGSSLTPWRNGGRSCFTFQFALLLLVVFCWSHCYWRPGEVHSGTQGNGGCGGSECVTGVWLVYECQLYESLFHKNLVLPAMSSTLPSPPSTLPSPPSGQDPAVFWSRWGRTGDEGHQRRGHYPQEYRD